MAIVLKRRWNEQHGATHCEHAGAVRWDNTKHSKNKASGATGNQERGRVAHKVSLNCVLVDLVTKPCQLLLRQFACAFVVDSLWKERIKA